MKKINYFFFLLFLFLLAIGTILKAARDNKYVNDYSKINNKYIDNYEINEVKEKADLILKKNKNIGYYDFTKNTYSNIIFEILNSLHQKKIRKKRKVILGKYKDLIFHSLYKSKSGNSHQFKIFRFKGIYDSGKNVEIRLYLNEEGDIANLNVISWKEDLFAHYRIN